MGGCHRDGRELDLPLEFDRRRRVVVSRPAAATDDRDVAASKPGGVGYVEAGATAFVLDQEAAQPLEHRWLTALGLHSPYRRARARRYDRCRRNNGGRCSPKDRGSLGRPTTEAASVDAATAAVDRILASTESAVSSIVRRTEHEVRGMAAEVDARIAREAIERTARLTRLRHELTERAAELAVHFDAILAQIDAVDAALAPSAGHGHQGRVDRQTAAVRMTLRERQRISVAYDQPVPTVDVVTPAPAPIAPISTSESRRRWWQLRSREAA